jgi:hypothetical protein
MARDSELDTQAVRERCDAEKAVLMAALKALEWLPEEEGDWAECPCCGARKMDGHIPDGCQLGAALAPGEEKA